MVRAVSKEDEVTAEASACSMVVAVGDANVHAHSHRLSHALQIDRALDKEDVTVGLSHAHHHVHVQLIHLHHHPHRGRLDVVDPLKLQAGLLLDR